MSISSIHSTLGAEHRKEINLTIYSFTERKMEIENVAMETQILPIIRKNRDLNHPAW
jgi:hypothetical protein